ncbi:MAG: hypothetical protein R3C28_08915 [Pirellulaceae bacterium]
MATSQFNGQNYPAVAQASVGMVCYSFCRLLHRFAMSNDTQSPIQRTGQRLLSIVIAIPVAVLAGLFAVFLLDLILPHGKGWQLPTIFIGAFISAGVAGVA